MSRIIEFFGALTSPSFAAAALDVAVKVALVLALALIVTRALRGASAALRHSIWSAAIAAALIMPVFTVALPSWHLPVPGAEAARALASRVERAVENDPALGKLAASRATAAIPPAGAVNGTVHVNGAPDESKTLFAAAAAAADLPTTAPVHATLVSHRDRLPLILSSVWVVGFIVALVPFFVGALRLRAIGRRARDIESDVLADYAARLAATLGIRRLVRVVEGDDDATPMTWGILRPIVLVPRGFEGWPESCQHDVLLHELAHVARFDCLTQHVARLVSALYWYNPLAWIAVRQLRVERERACDDRVLLAGARASEYAEHILSIARTLRAPRGAAALAMARPSQLEGRLLALLDARRPRAAVSTRRALGIGVASVAVAAFAATLTPWAAPRAEARESLRAGDRDAILDARPDTDPLVPARHRVRRDSLLELLRRMPTDSLLALLRSRSSDSLRATLEQLTAGASFDSLALLRNDSIFTELQALLASTGKSGTDSLTAALQSLADQHVVVGPGVELVDGQRLTYGPGGTPRVSVLGARSSKPDAFALPGCKPGPHGSSSASVSDDDDHLKASVKNDDCEITLESQGTVAFDESFTDIRALDPDGWVTIYDKGGSATHRLRIINDHGTLAREWSVNGTKQPYDAAAAQWLASSLQELDRYTNFSHGARIGAVYRRRGANGVLDEVAKTESDYGMRSDMERLLKLTKLDQPQTERVLGFAQNDINGDYDKSQLLQALLKQGLVTPALQGRFIAAAATISSDYERRQTLTALVQSGKLAAESQNAVLEAARGISSDYEMRELLVDVVKANGLSKATAPAFLAAAARIGSDYEMRTLLVTVMDEQENLDPSIIDSFLDLGAKRIGSDYDKAEFFIAVARKGPNTEAARDRVAKAAESISSESDYGRVLSSLRRLKNSSGGR